MVRNDDSESIYGERLQYDRTFKGPLSKRSCTDVLCLLIFAIFLAAWGYIGSYAIRNGDLNKLLVPTDSFNRKCGVDGPVIDKKYLFFFNLEKCIDPFVPITGCPTPQVCVSSCPTQTFVWDTMKNSLSIAELKNRLICQSDLDKNRITTKAEAEIAINENRCARWYVKSTEFLNRCVWTFAPDRCEYIPSFLRSLRKRDISAIQSLQMTPKSSSFVSFSPNDPSKIIEASEETKTSFALTNQKVKEADEPILECSTRQRLGESIIKEKMIKTNTYLSQLVGNIVAHFYNGMEAQQFTPCTIINKSKTKNVNCEFSQITILNLLVSKRCVPSDVEGINRLVHDIKLPPEITTLTEKMLGADLDGVGEKIVEDIISSWIVIFLALVITMVVSLLFISLMRWVATPIVWFSILGVLFGLGFGVYYSITQYNYWKATPTVPYHSLNLSSSVKNVFQKHTTWLYASIALSIALAVILLLVIVIRSRIRIAIALVKEGSKAVSCVVATVFFPIFPWFLYMCTITLAVGIGLYLASVGEPSFKVIKPKPTLETCSCEGLAISYTLGAQCDPTTFQSNCFVKDADPTLATFFKQKTPCVDTGCYFEGIRNPAIVSYFQAYNVVGFLWLSFFISAFGDMVLAATFATWYWTFHKSDVPYFVLTRAFGRTVRYHLGTLALGAFILTICRIIRLILEYIDQKLKKFDNSVTRAILCCMKCFFWCLENFLRFLNRNAYIMCAIHGKNFCVSAKDSFNLLMRNFLRVIAVDQVTDFLFFLSKLLLTGAAGIGTYYYLTTNLDAHRLNYIAVPITIVVIATFLITSVFFGVYSMAVDTLFLCFLEDCERNDGTEEKPYFMSKQLMRILHKRNKMPKQ